jgi:ribonuclease P protein component
MADRSRAERRHPRTSRLLTKRHFDRVFREGRKVVRNGLVAWIAPAPAGTPDSRLGLSVGRRVGGAVQRNRVKRVLREAFRTREPGPDAPFDLVLIARPGLAPTTLDAARRALAAVLAPGAGRRRPRR